MNPNEPYQPQQPTPVVPPVQQPDQAPQDSVPQQPVLPQSGMPAFMYPQSNLPDATPSRAHSSKVPLIIALLLIVLVGGGVAAFALTGKKPADPQNNPNQAQSNEEKPEVSKPLAYKLSDDITLTSVPTFTIPSPDGWSIDANQTAQNGMIHSGGCKVTFTQAVQRTNAGLTDMQATDKVASDLIKGLKEHATISEVEEGTAGVVIVDKTEAVEFKTVAFKHSTQLTESRSIVTLRSIDGYIMGVRFFCQTPAFSDQLNQEIIDKLAIDLPEKS